MVPLPTVVLPFSSDKYTGEYTVPTILYVSVFKESLISSLFPLESVIVSPI